MGGLKRKVLMKCECGQTVAVGSVFCPYCQGEIQKKNAKVINREEQGYQKKIRGKGKKAK